MLTLEEFVAQYPFFDADWCEVCGRIVPEGTEHDWAAHGAAQSSAE